MSARPWPEQAHGLGRRRAGGGGEQWRLSFHSLCDKQLGVVRAVCPERWSLRSCIVTLMDRGCVLWPAPGLGQGGPSPAPCPGWSPRLAASRPQPRGCGRLQPCGGLLRVALRVALRRPRRSEAAPSSPRPSTSCLLPPAAGWCSERRQGRRGGGFRESCL